jgi:hypothetical protein
MAMLCCPCCERRIRIPLIKPKRTWRLKYNLHRCHACRLVWTVEAKITKHGYISRAWFSASGRRLLKGKRATKVQPESDTD